MNERRARAYRAYQKVKTLKPARSLFDLSHSVLLTADMFKLYPVCCMEMSPGDTFHIYNQSVTRCQPMNSPILSELWQNTHYFFVPYRILWDEWTKFITGGEDGQYGGDSRGEDVYPSEVSPELPRWNPTKNGVGTLWDYLGFPVGVTPNGALPLDFVRRCYNRIWNEYYRDENLQEPVSEDNEDILYRSWKKDYFTSALLSQQRGVAPALPLSGVGYNELYTLSQTSSVLHNPSVNNFEYEASWTLTDEELVIVSADLHRVSLSINIPGSIYYDGEPVLSLDGNILRVKKVFSIPSGSPTPIVTSSASVSFVSLQGSTTDIKDLRQAFQIQKWLELANRGGVRYTEFLRSFFGVSPRDDRLQRPEYIGGSKSPIIVSEVLQTSAIDGQPTPQGNMAGHGLGAQRTYIGSYTAVEYGLVMGLMSYTTPPVYTQGINRQFLRRSKYDFLFPQFTGLSEQAIEGAEIFATDDATENRKVWGYNEIYDELRSMASRVVGKMRTVFNYWHLARFFDSKPALNGDFISGKDVSKRIFAVPTEDAFIVNYANIIRAVRPLPKYGSPKGV